jgi:signal transduction histidine kinase
VSETIAAADQGAAMSYGEIAAILGRRRSAGLGLYIARGIIEAHGGRMSIESRVDEGSRFWFTLPCRRTRGEHPRIEERA